MTCREARWGRVGAIGAWLLAGCAASGQDQGDILWTYTALMQPTDVPLVAPSGDILWTGGSASGGDGGLHALAPDGSLRWVWPGGASNGVISVAEDGAIYAGVSLPGGVPAVTRLTPEGQIVWQYPVSGMYSFIGGPDIGPDGNVYVTADIPFGHGPMISLTRDGGYRWEIPGFSKYGGGTSHIVFSGDLLFKIEGETPIPPGLGVNPGLVAMDASGQIAWHDQFNVGGTTHAERQPTVSPTSGWLHVANHNNVRTYDSAGDIVWDTYVGFSPQGMGEIAAGLDGRIFAVHGYLGVFGMSQDGALLWLKEFVLPDRSDAAPAVKPDGSAVAVVHMADYDTTPVTPAGVKVFDPAKGSVIWSAPLPPIGLDHMRPLGVKYSADGSVLYISAQSHRPYPQTASGNSFLIAMATGAGACYANCDGSTGSPALNVADFGCFLSRFASGEPYANCDGSTGMPALNVADFGCFLSKFAAGCD